MIILPILTTSLVHFSLKGWENVLFELGSGRVKIALSIFFHRCCSLPVFDSDAAQTSPHNVIVMGFSLCQTFKPTSMAISLKVRPGLIPRNSPVPGQRHESENPT